MDREISSKNTKNLGNYKKQFIKEIPTVIDGISYSKLVKHIGYVSDTLFLPLAKGVRMPALFVSNIYYDHTSDLWKHKNNPYSSLQFVSGVDSSVQDTSTLIYLDVTVNQNVVAKTDVTPLLFVNNTSSGEPDTANGFFFPRISKTYIDGTNFIARVVLEKADQTGWAPTTFDGSSGFYGAKVSFEGLFQSASEHADMTFIAPGFPYYVPRLIVNNKSYIQSYGTVYVDYNVDLTGVPWSSKTRTKAVPWAGDCSTGSSVPGARQPLSPWESVYHTGEHFNQISGLLSSTQYKLYIQIDAKVGHESLDWTSLGCYTTPVGEEELHEY